MKQIETRLFVRVWAVLLALLALTVWTSLIPLGTLNVVLNISIAVAKAAIVLIYFMHIGRGEKTTKIAAATGLVWLILLTVLSFGDFMWRGS